MYCNVMYDYNDTAVMIIDIFQENKSTDYTTIVIVSLERTTYNEYIMYVCSIGRSSTVHKLNEHVRDFPRRMT